MQIKSVSISNFRGYRSKITIDFDDLTCFVGKNDIGKSTVLEALDIFFNEKNALTKLDKQDINIDEKEAGNLETIIEVKFCNLPQRIIIDETRETTLEKEYLLDENGDLVIVKRYNNAGSPKVFIKAYHPTGENSKDLLLMKIAGLKKIVETNNIDCKDKTVNSELRQSIWNHFKDELELEEIEIDANKEGAKELWLKLEQYLPIYSLFKSDRSNSDKDDEAQDPLKEAVKQILAEESVISKCKEIAETVLTQLEDVTKNTLSKLQEMNPAIAESLNPAIPEVEDLKWANVFNTVSIAGDSEIPINKRGSGIRRLILISFFRAEAEAKMNQPDLNSNGVIYAIEEPETSQHKEHQRILINSLKELSEANNTQVILTTHSPEVIKQLDFENVRLILKDDNGISIIDSEEKVLPFDAYGEINYLAFNDVNEEYHIDLYSVLESHEKIKEFRQGKRLMKYKYLYKGEEKEKDLSLSEYIRHQIHHPENEANDRYTKEQLKESIELMREFIIKENLSWRKEE